MPIVDRTPPTSGPANEPGLMHANRSDSADFASGSRQEHDQQRARASREDVDLNTIASAILSKRGNKAKDARDRKLLAAYQNRQVKTKAKQEATLWTPDLAKMFIKLPKTIPLLPGAKAFEHLEARRYHFTNLAACLRANRNGYSLSSAQNCQRLPVDALVALSMNEYIIRNNLSGKPGQTPYRDHS